jgi:predicted ester cyclase
LSFRELFLKAEDEAWKGNVKALEDIDDKNVVLHMSGMPDVVGIEGHKNYIKGALSASSDVHQEWSDFIRQGNLAAVHYKSSFKYTGQMPGFPPPKGQKVNSDWLMMFRLKNDKIIEGWMNGTVTGLSEEISNERS